MSRPPGAPRASGTPGPGGERATNPAAARGLAVLWVAQAVSLMGSWASHIALMTLVVNLGGGALELSLVSLMRLLPGVAVGPLAGAIIDRLDKKKVMIVSDVCRALTVLALVRATTTWHIYVLTTAAGLFSAFSTPSRQSAIPTLAQTRDRLVRWNSILATTQNVALSLGPGLGGLIAGIAGPKPVFVFDAATFIASAGILLLLPPLVGLRTGGQRSVAPDFVAGIRYVRQQLVLTMLALTSATVVFGAMMANVVLILYVENVLGAGPAVFGTYMSLLGAGSVLGALAAPVLMRRLPLPGVYIGALALISAAFVVLGAWPGVMLAGVMHLVRGVAVGLADVGLETIMGLQIAEEMRGRAFAFYGALSLAARGASMALTGVLAAVTPIPLLFVAAGCLIAAATGACSWGLRRMRAGLADRLGGLQPAPSGPPTQAEE